MTRDNLAADDLAPDDAAPSAAARRVLDQFDQVFADDEPLPDDLVHIAQELYVWRDVDAEMLDLLVDSAQDDMVLTRAEPLQRFMAFGDDVHGVHLECVEDAGTFRLRGSVVPAGVYDVGAHPAGKDAITTTTDELGGFDLGPLHSGSTRLSIVRRDHEPMLTPWFRLEA